MKVFLFVNLFVLLFGLFVTAKPIDSNENSEINKNLEKIEKLSERLENSVENNETELTEVLQKIEDITEKKEELIQQDSKLETTTDDANKLSENDENPVEVTEKVEQISDKVEEPVENSTDEVKENEETTQNSEELESTTESDRGQVPARSAKKDDMKPKKSLRSEPVYYVKSEVNGRFGKSVKAYKPDELQ